MRMYRISQHLRKYRVPYPRKLGDAAGNNHSKHLSYGYKRFRVGYMLSQLTGLRGVKQTFFVTVSKLFIYLWRGKIPRSYVNQLSLDGVCRRGAANYVKE